MPSPRSALAAAPIRFAAVDRLGVVHDLGSREHESTVAVACAITHAPIATLSLQRPDGSFSVRIGDELHVVAAADSFTRHVVADPDGPTVVRSLLEDPRFAPHRVVAGPPGLRAYIGVPVRSAHGDVLGALEVADMRVRNWSHQQVATTVTLGCLIEKYLELRQVLARLDG